MDALDNIMVATLKRKLQDGTLITSDYLPMDPFFPFKPSIQPMPNQSNKTYAFPMDQKIFYTSFQDPSIIEKGMLRHWYDVDSKQQYKWDGITDIISDFTQ